MDVVGRPRGGDGVPAFLDKWEQRCGGHDLEVDPGLLLLCDHVGWAEARAGGALLDHRGHVRVDEALDDPEELIGQVVGVDIDSHRGVARSVSYLGINSAPSRPSVCGVGASPPACRSRIAAASSLKYSR